MIEINFVPEQLRKKRRTAAATVSVGLPKEAMIGLIGGFIVLLIVVSLIIQVFIGMRIAQRNRLKDDLGKLGAAKTNVDRVIDDIRTLQQKLKTLEQVTGDSHAVAWAPKLNEISDHIPRGVWLSKVAWEGNELIIEGSSVSKFKTEITEVHNFTANLKDSKLFMNGLASLELGMIKARPDMNLGVTDFTIKAEIKK